MYCCYNAHYKDVKVVYSNYELSQIVVVILLYLLIVRFLKSSRSGKKKLKAERRLKSDTWTKTQHKVKGTIVKRSMLKVRTCLKYNMLKEPCVELIIWV